MLLYGCIHNNVLAYFRTGLDVLKHYRATMKLKKVKMVLRQVQVYRDRRGSSVTQPAQSKNKAFYKLEQPGTWGDLCTLIGIFGLYSHFLPLYELDIRPWRYIFLNQPQLGTLSKK